MASPPTSSTPAAGRFGTFAGVFTPNVLTILGIILFLRTGWVVGQAGLYGALLIIALANAISFLTGLSLSAIATSMDVKAGGNYYLISRSLGLEIGGAIGIPLYLSQAISVAFYIIGFTEAISGLAAVQGIPPQTIATGVALVFVVIAWVGADFALKIQYGILAILIAALISFFTGGWGEFVEPNLTQSYTDGISFWVVFAVFFPAVTGIEVGISLSGDLKDPSHSIPLGTITSIVVTALVYVAAAVWFAFQLPADILISDNLSMERIASVPVLILAGVAASTLSSALGSVLAAPRTLQAVSKDRVVPGWIASNLGSPTEPRMAVLITGVVAVVVIWAGDLDFVAPIITMFFLNTYGMVNLVAGIERLVGNPSYRPRFNVPLIVPLLGAAGCYGAMFLINAPATVAAIVISYGLFFALSRRGTRRAWGDVRSGIWTSIARYALLNLDRTPAADDTRNWRPHLMVFTGQPHNREHLVALAEWLSRGRGLVTFFQLITGTVAEANKPKLRETAERHIRSYIQDRQMTAFAEAQIVPDFREGAVAVAQAHGIGPLESNTALMGWSGTPGGRVLLMDLVRSFSDLHKSVLFLRMDETKGFGQKRRIHVWWGGRGGNGDLMLLLAYLLTQHRFWDDAEICVHRIVDAKEAIDATRAHTEALLDDVRVEANVVIIVRKPPSSPDRLPILDLIARNSVNADLTFLGMPRPADGEFEAAAERLDRLAQAVGTAVLVHNGQDQEGLLEGE
ncbi:MAG: amino acid permease [Bacteroidota bacterium]